MKTTLRNGDSLKIKQDPCGQGWVIDGRQTGNKTGQVYDNGDEITSEMVTPIKFHETATAHGNIFRATVSIGGQDFTLEMGLDRKWVNIIDAKSRCESCIVDEDGDVISDGGEYVTEVWTDADWKNLTNSIGFKLENN